MVDESRPDPPAHETYRTAQALAAGQLVLDRYRLKKFLGRGGFGVVWLAQDEELDLQVAIKFLSDLIVNNPEAVADLKRETRHSLRLTHPHIVRIHGFLQGPQIAGISMEFVDGGTLSAIKAARATRCFDAADLAGLVTELIDALDYAHTRAQIVHRDLKPGNLMLTGANELKVADFGISRSISDTHTRLTDAGATSGTPAYMSPQQMMGQPPRVTDDIYSLGATLYDLLAGKPPFYTGDVPAQVLRVTPPPLAQRRAELEIAGGAPVPPEWEETLAACLAKSPENRPANVREVAQRLGLPVPSRPLTDSRPPAAAAPEAATVVAAAEANASGGSAAPSSSRPPTGATPATGGAGTPSASWTPTGASTVKPSVNVGPLLVVGGLAVALVVGALFVFTRNRPEPAIVVQRVPVPTAGETTTPPVAPAARVPQATPVAPPSLAPARSAADAARMASLLRTIPADLEARRWESAQRGLNELSALDPERPELSDWQQMLLTGRGIEEAERRREEEKRQAEAAAATTPPPASPAATPVPAPAEVAGSATTPSGAREPTPPDAPSSDGGEAAARQVVGAYARALADLDIERYAGLWVALSAGEREKLNSAFSQIKSQTVDVTVEGVDPSGAEFTVRGRERRRVEMKQGSPQSLDRAVRFTVGQSPDGRWRIVRREYK